MPDTSKPNRAAYSPDLRDFLKQIVYGGNDGIVTTFAIVAGFAGANADGVAQIGTLAVLVFGFANLFADAVSMGLGEFLSGRSKNDLYTSRRKRQIAFLNRDPAQTVGQLDPYFSRTGIAPEDQDQIKQIAARNPAFASDLIMAQVYGMETPDEKGLAVGAWATFGSFVVFGIIPLSPFILSAPPAYSFAISLGATFGALGLLGLLRWVATREPLLKCVGETVFIGGICALVAYLVGAIVG